MTAAAIIADARADGVVLSLAPDGVLTFKGPRRATDKWLPILRDAKPNIVAHLSRTQRGEPWDATDWQAHYDERAGILEHDSGLSRVDAETQAWECCIAEWLNRHPVRSCPGRCHACGGDGALEALLPYGTSEAGHTWLHGRCWPGWQTKRTAEAAAALMKLGITRSRSVLAPSHLGSTHG